MDKVKLIETKKKLHEDIFFVEYTKIELNVAQKK